MIQSRASFLAAILIGLLILAWTLRNFVKTREIKELFPNLFYIVPFFLAIMLNQLQTAQTGQADAISRAATIRLNTNNNSINQRLRY